MTITTTQIFDNKAFGFENLIYGRTPSGDPYYQAVVAHSDAITRAYLAKQYAYYQANMVGVVAIPRGGIPTARATLNALTDNLSGDIIYIESRIKTTNDDDLILGENLLRIRPQVVFVTDGVIASGHSISRHFSAIAAAKPECVIVLSNCSTEAGMDYLSVEALKYGFPRFEQVTGRIFDENECQWMDIAGKKVLFVGYNEASGVDYQLPDFGDWVQRQQPTRS